MLARSFIRWLARSLARSRPQFRQTERVCRGIAVAVAVAIAATATDTVTVTITATTTACQNDRVTSESRKRAPDTKSYEYDRLSSSNGFLGNFYGRAYRARKVAASLYLSQRAPTIPDSQELSINSYDGFALMR